MVRFTKVPSVPFTELIVVDPRYVLPETVRLVAEALESVVWPDTVSAVAEAVARED